MDQETLENWFTSHRPEADQLPKYAALRATGLPFATVVNDKCPDSADKSAAIRLIREATWSINVAIACAGR